MLRDTPGEPPDFSAWTTGDRLRRLASIRAAAAGRSPEKTLTFTPEQLAEYDPPEKGAVVTIPISPSPLLVTGYRASSDEVEVQHPAMRQPLHVAVADCRPARGRRRRQTRWTSRLWRR